MRAIWTLVANPDDVAVVGCGNLAYSDFLRVPLSSVDQGSAKIGKTAAAMALKLAQSRSQTGLKTKLVQPSIVVRASSLRNHPGVKCDGDNQSPLPLSVVSTRKKRESGRS